MDRSSYLAAGAVFGALALAGGGLATFKYGALHPADAAPAWEMADAVQVVSARRVDWRPTADLVGTVFSLRSVRVQSEVAGRLREVRFASGAIVEAGQVLATLDDAPERADLAVAQASVRVAEADVHTADARVHLAELELQRLTRIADARVTTEIELDRARSEVDRARAERERALAAVDEAAARVAQVQATLAKHTLTAPFRGRVGLRSVHEGQYLGEGAFVVGLEEVSDRIYLDFAVPQEYVARVRPGTVVLGTSPVLGQGPVRIEVVALDAFVDGDTRNVRVRAIVDDEGGALRAGMSVPIHVPMEDPRPYVVVPATAVRRTSYADQVFVIGPGEGQDELRASQRFVKLGPTVGDDVIVLEGLEAGERVAATGSFKLREGALVKAVEAEAPAPAPDAGGR